MSKKSRLVDLNMKIEADVKQALYEIANARTEKKGKRVSIAAVAREALQEGLKNLKK